MFLCETKLLVRELRGVAFKLGFDYWLGVDCVATGGGRRGGLALFWSVDCLVELSSFSLNHINVRVGEVNPWRFTGIYGHPEDDQKWRTWSLLRRLATENQMPWLCVGDFNEILSDSKKLGGNLRRDDRMRDFRFCLEDCGLKDLGFIGHQFTWSNKQSGVHNIQERLDRGLAKDLWWSLFPSVRVKHLTRVLSDHYPIHVDWAGVHKRGGLQRRVKLYRFEDMWLKEDDFARVVLRAWGSGGTPSGLARCISNCGDAFSNWSSNVFGHLPREIEKIKKEIDRF